MNNGDIDFEIVTGETSMSDNLGFSTVPVIPIQSKDIPIDTNFKCHTRIEANFTKELKKINLDEVEKDLSERTYKQHIDPVTQIPVFNAHHKKVLIRGENGESVLINNHEEMWKQQLKNAGKLDLARKTLDPSSFDTTTTVDPNAPIYDDDDFIFED